MVIKLGNKIGEGGCAEVFEIGNNQVVKLAKENTSFEAVRREFNHSCIVWKSGLPIPQPYDLVEIDGRPGIIVEHIVGETIFERLFNEIIYHKQDEDQSDIQLTAQLLSGVHHKHCSGYDLPSQRSALISDIMRVTDLSDHEKEKVISLLIDLPSKQCLCHGDPNPANIIVKNDGKAVLIDWMNATIGNPEADLAEYIIMIRYAVLPASFPVSISKLFDDNRENMISIFMDEYTKLTGMTYDEVAPWIVPMAARKLSTDGIADEEKEKLVQVIRESLSGDVVGI